MQRKWSVLQGTGAIFGMLILIFDSRLALEGARTGLELCIKTVFPALFPFFVLSTILTNSLGRTNFRFLQFLSSRLRIPPNAGSILIPAFLGGYPVGAKCVGDLYHSKQISRRDAERLLSFCSNAGPAFIFGMVSGFFPEQRMVWMLWLIHIVSAVLTAAAVPAERLDFRVLQTEQSSQGIAVILTAAKAMCIVCSWVVLFRIMITFLDRWFLWILPDWLHTLLLGCLELTNGCCALLQIVDVRLRFIICSCILAFGGVCVLFQTVSVTAGLSISCYIHGKWMQMVFSLLLSCTVMLDHGLVFAVCIPVFLFIFRKEQNRYSNPGVLPV